MGIKSFGGASSMSMLGSKPLMVFSGELFETDEARQIAAVAAAPSSRRCIPLPVRPLPRGSPQTPRQQTAFFYAT